MALRTWELPKVPEEPTDIEGVRDRDGDLWRPGRDSGWFNCGQGRDGWSRSVDRVGSDWISLLYSCAPLREVTRMGERVGPIQITKPMLEAASLAAVRAGEVNTYRLVTVAIEAALDAGGYEVTV